MFVLPDGARSFASSWKTTHGGLWTPEQLVDANLTSKVTFTLVMSFRMCWLQRRVVVLSYSKLVIRVNSMCMWGRSKEAADCNYTRDVLPQIDPTKTGHVQKSRTGAVGPYPCPTAFPVCHFSHISAQMTAKLCLWVGIEFTSFQDPRDLFRSIGKLSHPATSSLLLLSLTFPQLCFPAKPVGVAKVSLLWASI